MKWYNNMQFLASTVFTGFMFVGIGIGLLFDEVAAGTLIGMGVGFASRAIVIISARENENLPK